MAPLGYVSRWNAQSLSNTRQPNCTVMIMLKTKFIGRACLVFALLVPTSSACAQLLVSDRATNQITKYDPVTGDFLGVLVEGDPSQNGGLFFPSAMIVGPNDELLVASQVGSVLRYDLESGDFLGSYAEQLNVPSGLAYNAADDQLFVSTLGNFDSELVLQYTASTGELDSAIGEGTGATGRAGMVFGPDGNLYVSSFADPEFFLGAVLQIDGETLEPKGLFAGLFPAGPEDPFLAGASGLAFHDAAEEGTYNLDVVGLFSNNVARFGVAATEAGLMVQSAGVLIDSGLDFPSAIQSLGDGTMLVTNLGNDNPDTGELRPGSIGRFDVATGEFLGTFAAGGENNLSQPTALLLLDPPPLLDCGRGDIAGQLAELNLLEGDLDANGEVAFVDFLIMANSFGMPGNYGDGDIDCNGTVEFSDFLRLAENYGKSSPVVAAVPEPAGTTVALLGCVALLSLRRRE